MKFIKDKTKAVVTLSIVSALTFTSVSVAKPAYAESLHNVFIKEQKIKKTKSKDAFPAWAAHLDSVKSSNLTLGKTLEKIYNKYMTEEDKTIFSEFLFKCQNETDLDVAKNETSELNEWKTKLEQKKQQKIAEDEEKKRAAEEAAKLKQQQETAIAAQQQRQRVNNNVGYSTQQKNSGISSQQPSTNTAYSSSSSAKDWIISKESGGNYNATNGRYYGAYQLDKSYLNGDYSQANQDRVAENYVQNRYGSWENAKNHWLSHGWY